MEHIQGAPAAALISDLPHLWSRHADIWAAQVCWHLQVLLACDCSPEEDPTVSSTASLQTVQIVLPGKFRAFPYLQATTQRGWAMPELADVRTKSKALERSGFTMAQSPKLRQSSRSTLAQVPMHPHPSDLYLI